MKTRAVTIPQPGDKHLAVEHLYHVLAGRTDIAVTDLPDGGTALTAICAIDLAETLATALAPPAAVTREGRALLLAVAEGTVTRQRVPIWHDTCTGWLLKIGGHIAPVESVLGLSVLDVRGLIWWAVSPVTREPRHALLTDTGARALHGRNAELLLAAIRNEPTCPDCPHDECGGAA